MRRVLTAILPVLLLVITLIPPNAKAETELVIDAHFLKIKVKMTTISREQVPITATS